MKRTSVFILTASLLLATIPFTVSADASDDIPTNATNSGVHDSLVAALAHADLVTTLQATGPFTVFAPTDAAFAAAGINLTDYDTDEENATLRDILLYHVYSGQVESSAVTDGLSVEMENGDNVSFTVTGNSVMIEGANVTTPDVMSSNGVIHIIDKVLMPPADLQDIPTVATSTGIHTALVGALAHANLVATLQGTGPFTVFAPTDAAFAAAGINLADFDTPEENATLSDILLYHVASGQVESSGVIDGLSVEMVNGDNTTFSVSNGTVMIGDANVTTVDVMASNGVIHVIDKVLMPPVDLGDIPTIATGTGIHTSLVAALVKADLVTTLQGDGPFTVFAPSDDAFAAAGINLDDFTTTEQIATLSDILLYHVVSGTTTSSDLSQGMTNVTAANNDNLMIHVENGSVMVGSSMANVTLADVMASNGVIHVIDQVLMPPADATVVADPFDGVDCAVTVGIGSTGYAYSPAVINIDVGQTVCWLWEDASMPHNVKEITGSKSTIFVANGVTSGAAAADVAFSYTFTEDTTFYYACEPHVELNMFGEVVVGTGGVQEASDTSSDDSEDTPGFLIPMVLVSMIGALILIERRSEGE